LGNFARALHHLDMKDVKKRHLKERAAKKIKEENNRKEAKAIQEIAKKYKSNWREELINEGEWQPVASGAPTNAVTQNYGYFDGGSPVPNSETGQQVTMSLSGIGLQGVESSTTIDLGFGETMNVSAPTYSQLAMAGYTPPLKMVRRGTPEDTNPKLDSSQEFVQKIGADVMMNARVSGDLNIISQTNTARKVFMDYLTGKMKAGRWNEYLGKNYINNALKNATLNPDGSVTVGDNVIGGARNIEYDEVSGTYKINFMGLGFQTNESEFAKNPADYSEFWKSVFNKLGKYSADAQPQFHVPTKVLQGWAKLLNIGFGAIFGKVIEYYKAKGTAIDVNAFIEFSPEEIYELNPQLAYDIEQRNLESDGFDTGHGYTSPPDWLISWASKSQFSGDLRSLWNNKTRTWNLGGKIVDNDGNPIKKATTPKPSKSKSVERIKSMAKTKRQSLSLDEPIVRSSKKSKKKGVDI